MKSNLSIKSAFSEGYKFWVQNIITILGISILVYLPAHLMIETISFCSVKLFPNLTHDQVKLLNNIYNLIRSIFSLILISSIIYIIKNHETKRNFIDEIKASFVFGLKKFPYCIAIEIWVSVMIFIYGLLLIIPGIYKGVQLSFAQYLWIDKDYDIEEACVESINIVKEKWWSVFFLSALIIIAKLILELIICALFLKILLLDKIYFSLLIAIIIGFFESYFYVVKAKYYYLLVERVTKDQN